MRHETRDGSNCCGWPSAPSKTNGPATAPRKPASAAAPNAKPTGTSSKAKPPPAGNKPSPNSPSSTPTESTPTYDQNQLPYTKDLTGSEHGAFATPNGRPHHRQDAPAGAGVKATPLRGRPTGRALTPTPHTGADRSDAEPPTGRDNQDDHVKEVPELIGQAGTGT